uniref:WAP domain-containing protein n=1 Tax=Setaria digitata TaxID=48799 RepID=A0A915PSA3_9BILA
MHDRCLKNRRFIILLKESPLRVINLAVEPPINIFLNGGCKYDNDCTSKTFCWNGYCVPRGNLG